MGILDLLKGTPRDPEDFGRRGTREAEEREAYEEERHKANLVEARKKARRDAAEHYSPPAGSGGNPFFAGLKKGAGFLGDIGMNVRENIGREVKQGGYDIAPRMGDFHLENPLAPESSSRHKGYKNSSPSAGNFHLGNPFGPGSPPRHRRHKKHKR